MCGRRLHPKILSLECLRNGTRGERGKGTLFDEVATFHSLPRPVRKPLRHWRRGALEFAFGLQPIIKLSSWETTALEIEFICAETDFFVTWGLVRRSIFYVNLNRACLKLRGFTPHVFCFHTLLVFLSQLNGRQNLSVESRSQLYPSHVGM